MYWARVSVEIKSFRSKNKVVSDWSVMGLLKTGFGDEKPTFNSSVFEDVISMTRRNAGTCGSESTADQREHQTECSSNTRNNSAFTLQWLTDKLYFSHKQTMKEKVLFQIFEQRTLNISFLVQNEETSNLVIMVTWLPRYFQMRSKKYDVRWPSMR